MRNVIYYLEYHMSEFTESEQIIAKHFVKKHHPKDLKIIDVAEELYVSTATISRFVKKIGYSNYKSFIHEYNYALSMNEDDSNVINKEAESMWDMQSDFYKKLYSHFATIDLNYISNKMMNAKNIYTFGFGKTQDTMDMIIYRLEIITQKIRSVPHFEHLIYMMNNVMSYDSYLIIFCHSEEYAKDLQKVVKIAESKFIPILIVTLDTTIKSTSNSMVVTLYPFKDDTVHMYATTMYAPYLLFIDGLFMAMYKKQNTDNKAFINF